jgi:predicted DNA-binding transcriptional regulator AlpA
MGQPHFEDGPAMPVTIPDVYLRTRQVQQRYGNCSAMWIERRLATDPAFPRPVYFGRYRFWKLSDLEAWEKAQAEEPRKRRTA